MKSTESNSEAVSPAQQTPEAPRAERFLVNVLWTWVGIGANFFAAFFLTRYTIRQLGDERYGIWALAFALIDYFWLFDLGLRSAVVNFTARFRAREEWHSINEVINTALGYFFGVSLLVLAASLSLSGHVHRFFQIGEGYRQEFATLVLMTGISLSVGIVCCVFQAGLEAFQKFKLYNHISIVATVARVAGCWTVLSLGYGIVAMGWVVVFSQFAAYGMSFLVFRRVFPQLRFSVSLIARARLKEMATYGISSFFANSASMLLWQGPSIMVGHYRPEAYVGYYSLPNRLLQYAVDAIARIGFITAPNTADMVARGRLDDVARFGMYINRYCLTAFLPLSTFVLIYGRNLIYAWVGPRFAAESAPLLPAFVISTTFAMAAQFNSSSILFGLAKHSSYARILAMEAALLVTGLLLFLPPYGIAGAAWVSATLMLIHRGCFTPWMVCRSLNVSFSAYMRSIYLRPLLVLAPVLAGAWWMKGNLLAGENWTQLLAAAAIITAIYLVLAYRFCLEPGHRDLLHSWIARRLGHPQS